MTDKIRIRFAPSPTGFLHIGNFRVALFDYLIAKNLGGELILRIEDTDSKREVEGAAEKLIKVLDDFGIEFNEGPHIGGQFAPYTQSERIDIYKKYSDQLLKEGKVYRCFCTEDRLIEMRANQEAHKLPPRYDRLCRELSLEESDKRVSAGEPYVIRQKMPLEGKITVHDELRSDIIFDATDLDDQVLIKSNGIPTYQFASVIDDHTMEISHVTRGDEWVPSYPKNILLYQALNWTAPKFIHFPLILNKEGGKLSKRKGDVFVEDYLAKGYLPEAMINFCALLGWHPKGDNEILTLEELVKEFFIDGIGISPAIFDLEKLNYYNGYYIRLKKPEELVMLCTPFLKTAQYNLAGCYLDRIIAVSSDRLKTLQDIVEISAFFFKELDYSSDLLLWKTLTLEAAKNNLTELITVLEKISEDNWVTETLEEEVFMYLKTNDKKNGDYLWPWRVAVTGEKNSPSPFEVSWALGKEKTLNRIREALKK
jgi:glutamyl-tRNA synthetase